MLRRSSRKRRRESRPLAEQCSVAASMSFHASFSQSSDDWCTVWKSSSSRWTHSSGVFWSASRLTVFR